MPRNRNRRRPAEATQTPTDPTVIPYNDAVREAKQIVAREATDKLRLGELADRIQPIYREGTLAQFARAIDIEVLTLQRYRDVYRAWKEIRAPERELVSYSVLKELATLPDRAALIAENPRMTKAKARRLRREHDNAGPHDDRGEPGDDRSHDSGAASGDAPDTPEGEDDDNVSVATWQGRRLIDANKAAGFGRLEDWKRFPLDAGLMHAVENVIRAFLAIRRFHRNRRDRTGSESLRQDSDAEHAHELH